MRFPGDQRIGYCGRVRVKERKTERRGVWGWGQGLVLGGLSLLKSGRSPRTWGAREQVEGGDVGEVRGSILGQVQECPVGSVPAHTYTNLSTPFPVFLIIPPVPWSRSCCCCAQAGVVTPLRVRSYKYVLCLYCGKSLMQVTHTHSPCSPSFCRMCRAQWMMMGKKKNQKRGNKGTKTEVSAVWNYSQLYFPFLSATSGDTNRHIHTSIMLRWLRVQGRVSFPLGSNEKI